MCTGTGLQFPVKFCAEQNICSHPALDARVVRVPGDDGDAEVARQLQEVLRGRCAPPKVLTESFG